MIANSNVQFELLVGIVFPVCEVLEETFPQSHARTIGRRRGRFNRFCYQCNSALFHQPHDAAEKGANIDQIKKLSKY